MDNFDETVDILEAHDIKPSYQRCKILEFLMDHRDHPTADKIFRGLADSTPSISKATVYNTLKLFLEKDLVSPMSVDHLEIRYDIVTEDHGHFVCDKCGTVYNFPYAYSNKYQGLDGFDIEKEEIILRGTCKKCLNN